MPDHYKACELEGCDKPHASRGLCKTHYERWRRHGDDFDQSPIGPKLRLCEVEGCDLKHFCKGLCQAHYHRMKHAEKMGRPGQWSREPAYTVPPGRKPRSWREGR